MELRRKEQKGRKKIRKVELRSHKRRLFQRETE